MATTAISIEGLAAFRRDLKRIDPVLVKGVRVALKESAEIVADETRRRAPVRSGKLKGTVRSFTSGNKAGVRVNARRVSRGYPGGYPYPRRIEFEGGRAGTMTNALTGRLVGGTTAGPRAFIAPALEAKRGEVVRRLEEVIDDVAGVWAGRGGLT